MARPQGKKTGRLPPLTMEFTSPSFDFHAPIGSWHMDSGISDLIDSEILRYPIDLGIKDKAAIYGMVRPQLVGEAMNALTLARSINHSISTKKDQEKQVEELKELRLKINQFGRKMQAITESLSLAGFPDSGTNRNVHYAARDTAAHFEEQLDQLIDQHEALIRPSRAPNADHLTQLFVTGMKMSWLFLTKRNPPKTGGKILIKLSAGTWKDCRFPIQVSEAKRPLEDWFKERFKTFGTKG